MLLCWYLTAWITSEFRDDVSVHICDSFSTRTTSFPAFASARVIARPITPAPTTITSEWKDGAAFETNMVPLGNHWKWSCRRILICHEKNDFRAFLPSAWSFYDGYASYVVNVGLGIVRPIFSVFWRSEFCTFLIIFLIHFQDRHHYGQSLLCRV